MRKLRHRALTVECGLVSDPIAISPGGMDHHLGVVVITPALLAVSAAGLAALAGRWVALALVLPAWAIAVALLVPGGIAVQAAGWHVGGWVHLSWPAAAAALLGMVWIGLRCWPAAHVPAWPWALRMALVGAFPLVSMPLLFIPLQSEGVPVLRQVRWVIVAGTFIAWTVWPLPAMAGGLALTACTMRWVWRVPLLIAAVGVACP